MKYIPLLLFFVIVSCKNKSSDVKESKVVKEDTQKSVALEHKTWHSIEGLDYDPISLPVCDLAKVKKITVGGDINDVASITGHRPVPFYYQNVFSILHAKAGDDADGYWEVAFKHDSTTRIADISYRKVSSEIE